MHRLVTSDQNSTFSDFSPRQLEIIKAAGTILSSSGISGLTTKNLAREMNFTEGALYRHFTSKEEIIVAMLQYTANRLDEIYTHSLSSDQSPATRFETIFREQFRFFSNHPYFAVAVFSDGLMEESTRINDAITQIMDVKRKHLIPVIEHGQEQEIFTTTLSTPDLAHIVMGSIRLQMYKWRVSNFLPDLEEEGIKQIQALLKLIKSHK